MDRDEEFRRRAAEAEQRARQATTDDERATWLQLAEGWLGLLGKYPHPVRRDSPETLH
jgi:hypothetical protein